MFCAGILFERSRLDFQLLHRLANLLKSGFGLVDLQLEQFELRVKLCFLNSKFTDDFRKYGIHRLIALHFQD